MISKLFSETILYIYIIYNICYRFRGSLLSGPSGRSENYQGRKELAYIQVYIIKQGQTVQKSESIHRED